jgi:hypothetical protein
MFTRAIQDYLGHKSIQHMVRYTGLSPVGFKGFFCELASGSAALSPTRPREAESRQVRVTAAFAATVSLERDLGGFRVIWQRALK